MSELDVQNLREVQTIIKDASYPIEDQLAGKVMRKILRIVEVAAQAKANYGDMIIRRIAQSLAQLVDRKDSIDESLAEILLLHLAAIELIKQKSDDIDDQSQLLDLVDGLEKMSKKYKAL